LNSIEMYENFRPELKLFGLDHE